MTNTYTRGLAEYIASSTFEILPQTVVEHVKLLVLDTIGAGLLGAGLPWSERLRATMQALRRQGLPPSGALSCASPPRLLPCSMAQRCTASRSMT